MRWGKIQEGITDFSSVIDMDSPLQDNLEMALTNRAMAYSDVGDMDKAIADLDRILSFEQLSADRLESYHKLRKELEYLERKADPEGRANVKRHWRMIQKNMRAARKKGWFPDES